MRLRMSSKLQSPDLWDSRRLLRALRRGLHYMDVWRNVVLSSLRSV